MSAEACEAIGATERRLEKYPNRELALGSMPITRILPVRDRRLVGPWCFLDRFGPLSFTNEKPMDVAPHPHIGLQTVTWLLAGEVVHDDSLGSEAVLRPRGVNVMTSGGGIAHAEKCLLLAAGGVPDHIHLLIALGRVISLADLMRSVKANSSRWANDAAREKGFQWQEGYGGSPSVLS